MNFVMNHAPYAGSIAQPDDLQSSVLPLCYGCPWAFTIIMLHALVNKWTQDRVYPGRFIFPTGTSHFVVLYAPCCVHIMPFDKHYLALFFPWDYIICHCILSPILSDIYMHTIRCISLMSVTCLICLRYASKTLSIKHISYIWPPSLDTCLPYCPTLLQLQPLYIVHKYQKCTAVWCC